MTCQHLHQPERSQAKSYESLPFSYKKYNNTLGSHFIINFDWKRDDWLQFQMDFKFKKVPYYMIEEVYILWAKTVCCLKLLWSSRFPLTFYVKVLLKANHCKD